ncbi:RNA-dependent RNA polymerase [Botrytis cinerea RNA virus 2]|nr:RNA-dependent RNA polymerase [Botrytis cinerea RNA virus 2]
MAQHQFTENLQVSDEFAPFIDNEQLPESVKKGRHPRAQHNDQIRDNPGKWLHYEDERLAEVFRSLSAESEETILSEGVSGRPSHVTQLYETAGVLPIQGNRNLSPNYVLSEGALHKLDRKQCLTNLKLWLAKIETQTQNQLDHTNPWLSPVPEFDPVILDFSPNPRQLKTINANRSVVTKDEVTYACLLLKAHRDHTGDMEERKIPYAVIKQMSSASNAIRKMHLHSKRQKAPQTVKANCPITEYRDTTSPEYAKAYTVFGNRNKKEIKTLMQMAMLTGIHHHGLDGRRSPEVTATAKLARLRGEVAETSRAIAPGKLDKVDKEMQLQQLNWWHSEVTMWQAAYRWAISVISAKQELGLTDVEITTLTEWVFSRSSYRKLVASDATLDSTRDTAASEVTQAASIAIKWGRDLHPLVLIMDDMEYAVGAKTANQTVINAYNKTLKHLASLTLNKYGAESTLGISKPIGEIMLPSITEERGLSTNIIYGITNVSDTSIWVEPSDVALSDAVLLSYTNRTCENALKTVVSKGERTMIIEQPMTGWTATYISPPTMHGVGRDKTFTFLNGMHFREDAFQFPLPLVEFMSLFTTQYEPKTIEWRRERLRALVDPVTTQVHHRHASLILLMAVCGTSWAPCLDTVLGWEHVTNTFVSALLLAMASLPPALHCLMANWDGWAKATSEDEYIKLAKVLSTKLKALDNQVALGDFEIDLAPLFEWEVLRHRATLTGDIDDEILERRDTSANVKLGVEDIRSTCDGFFRDIKTKLEHNTNEGEKSPIYNDWESFYKGRVQATPAGSAFTLNAEMREARRRLKAAGIKDLTKTQVMAEMRNDLTLDQVLSQKPQVVAQVSFKLEWGKKRALFAATTEHWLPAAFALGNIEEYMPDYCPIGKAADAHRVCDKVMKMSTKGVVACLDAKNFNILHPHKVMSYILESASKVLGGAISPEQHKALAWLTKAELTQKVIVTDQLISKGLMELGIAEGWINEETLEDGSKILLATVLGGMFSGVRFTMFDNSSLNKIYYAIAEKLAGIKSDSLHSGDDIYAVFKSYADVYKMKAAFKKIGYTLQLGKCFLQGVREFLRISHKNANTSQYLARSAATAVHGRIESSAPTDFVAYAGALLRRGAELIVRHASRSAILDMQKAQCAGATARWAVPAFTWEVFLKVPAVLGGCASQPHEAAQFAGLTVDRTAETRGDTVQYLADTEGVKLAAKGLVEQLRIRKYHRRVAEAIAAAIAPKGVVMNYGMIVRWMTARDMTRLATVSGALRQIKQSREYILSKAAGLFNTLAINEHYWGDIGGVLSGIPTTWHSRALAFALAPANARYSLYSTPVFELHNLVSSETALIKLTNAIDFNITTMADYATW